jgi:hypothetical protein
MPTRSQARDAGTNRIAQSVQYISAIEGAKVLRCCPSTIIGLVKRGDVKGGKTNGRWRVNRESLVKFLSRRREIGTRNKQHKSDREG